MIALIFDIQRSSTPDNVDELRAAPVAVIPYQDIDNGGRYGTSQCITDVNRLDANLWVRVDPEFHDRPASIAQINVTVILLGLSL